MITKHYENEIIDIDPSEVYFLNKIHSRYSKEKPFSILKKEGQIVLKNGFVGIIKTNKREIIIQPRFKEFNFSVILKLWIMTNLGKKIISESDINSYSGDKDDFSINIIWHFISSVREICKVGLNGEYLSYEEKNDFLKGRLNISKYIQQPIKNTFICQYDEFNIDNLRNGLIKFCILKLIPTCKDKRLQKDLYYLLQFFRNINCRTSYTSIDFDILKNSSNRLNYHYDSAISLCELILRNLVISDVSGKMRWYSFLVNYDKLFEDFIRRMLQMEVSKEFIKLPQKNRIYSRFIYQKNSSEILKEYNPDIVFRYDMVYDKSEIIIDVKNKFFSTESLQNPNWFSNPDVFQLLSYLILQDSKKAILIYPSSERIEPIELDFLNSRLSEYELYAVFINLLSRKLYQSIKILSEDIASLT